MARSVRQGSDGAAAACAGAGLLLVAMTWGGEAWAQSCTHPMGAAPFGLLGDVNASGERNVADAVCLLLGVQAHQVGGDPAALPCLAQGWLRADLDCDATLTVVDATACIYLVLGAGVPSGLSPDATGCPAACASCAPPGGASCLVAGACVAEGERAGADGCQVCLPAEDPAAWTIEAAQTYFRDDDGDGYGVDGDTMLLCVPAPPYTALVGGDCDDADPDVNPGAEEICGNGIDDDCSGVIDEGCVQGTFRHCQAIQSVYPNAPSGVYSIDPLGLGPEHAFETWCDMERDGGGWTLVLQNIASVPSLGNLDWDTSVGEVTVRGGSLSAGAGGFDLLVGLEHWRNIGAEARVEVGHAAGVPAHQARYSQLWLDAAADYTLHLSGQTVTVGSTEPGLWTYHNGKPWSAFDRDNDDFVGNCAQMYGHPFWYGSCWVGSPWGGDQYGEAAFWVEYSQPFEWGAIWLRSVPRDCADVQTSAPDAPDGVYSIDPDGPAGAPPYSVYCDMTTAGGGWTMCYTAREDMVHLSTQTEFTGEYGAPGYRTDCRQVPFSDVLYVNHDTDQHAWFETQSGAVLTAAGLGYGASGAAAGTLFDGYGAASPAWSYQLNVCDSGWMWVGFMMSGYTGCYKQCGGWCSDTTTHYFRTDGSDNHLYNGVAFAENGHTNLPYKTMSVGLRRHAEPVLQSCRDVLLAGQSVGDGVYWIQPSGASSAIPVYCDMTTDGGGWTMCYTERDAMVHLSTQTAFTGTVGTPGYRADCRHVPFREVLYVNHDSDQRAWFEAQSGGPFTIAGLGYAAAGSAAGTLFTGRGVASTSWSYQLNVCDSGWMWVALMMSGYTGCYKQCGSWCGDTTTHYYRTDGSNTSNYNGVSFLQNGHTNVSYKTMSVGVR